MGFQDPKGTSNTQPYPGVAQVPDLATQFALRAVWDRITYLSSLVKGPITGTLTPDTKPHLGPRDAGTIFWATDFNRIFTWNGSNWIDGPSQLPRGTIAFYISGPDNTAGWIPCDGRGGSASTSQGTVVAFQAPALPQYTGMFPWIRV
jgi:hypothetical protein